MVELLDKHSTIKKIIAVDADEVILTLAKKYLKSSLEASIEYVIHDADNYIRNVNRKFDLVLFDVYIDNETPMKFMTGDFLISLKDKVEENGLLLFSKIEDSNKAKIENLQFEKTFSDVFPHSFSIDTNGNKIFTWINTVV